MQVRPADSAHTDADANFAGTGLRLVKINELERSRVDRARAMHHPRAHVQCRLIIAASPATITPNPMNR